ncbi:3-isopropylmalate dehydrogenase [Lactobacillus sp. CC-MHH1034]|uniref:3-isopropylmalate dehydrogenase n=1 Tax=Agrilactobacillus fermenti TaxID=2586909 RepID=UPI001E53AAF6|nr:3-isopropylmalate dehydrogenase [Agrilactobacillus fermenti]MCD2256979.1 3-isopropylmalate dehydrogenase [Agrilactobacillus fermenti]
MHEPTITVLSGDGIGPEIMSATIEVIKTAQQITQTNYHFVPMAFGGCSIDQFGEPLTDALLAQVKRSDAVLLAAVGGPKWDHYDVRPEAGLLGLRAAMKVYANLRPTKITAAAVTRSPLKAEIAQNTNFMIVRELTSGIYFGKPRHYSTDQALDTMVYNRSEINRIMTYAFKLAQQRDRHVTVVDKANVLATSKLWRDVAEEIHPQYPEITLDFEYVDAAAMKIVKSPQQFDVIVTSNLFGDILSDEAAAITGSIGTIPSESVSETGPNLYEPIHGSAPDIAGQNIADPIGMINSAVLMLQHTFNDQATANVIERAMAAVLQQDQPVDLGGQLNTMAFTQRICAQMQQNSVKVAPDYVQD